MALSYIDYFKFFYPSREVGAAPQSWSARLKARSEASEFIRSDPKGIQRRRIATIVIETTFFKAGGRTNFPCIVKWPD